MRNLRPRSPRWDADLQRLREALPLRMRSSTRGNSAGRTRHFFQIKADDKQLKELEESFRCPLCLSLRAEGSRNRRDGVTQKRYAFATDHMKNPMLQPPNSSMFPHSLAGTSVHTSWSRMSLVESTKTVSQVICITL